MPEIARITSEELTSIPVGIQLCEELAWLVVGAFDNETTNSRAFRSSNFEKISASSLCRLISRSAHLITGSGGAYIERHAEFSPSRKRLHRRIADEIVDLLNESWLMNFEPTPIQARSVEVGIHERLTNFFPIDLIPYSTKPRNGFWTSSLLPDNTSAWQVVVDTGYMGVGRKFVNCQATLPLDGLRIYDINSVECWQWLCSEFPYGDKDGFVQVCWPKVAEEFDGVHLSVMGLLRTQAVVDASTKFYELFGWDAESTVWLNPEAIKEFQAQLDQTASKTELTDDERKVLQDAKQQDRMMMERLNHRSAL